LLGLARSLAVCAYFVLTFTVIRNLIQKNRNGLIVSDICDYNKASVKYFCCPG